MDSDSISKGIIYEMALCIYANLIKESHSTSVEGESGFTFKASKGWLEKYKHQSGIHSVARHGEAAQFKQGKAEKYVGEIRDFVNAGGYLSQQMLSFDETGLFF